MKNTIIAKFWNDQNGSIVSAEIMLVASILVLGVIVGVKSVRDSIVTELADVGQAFSSFDQSFCVSGVCGHGASSRGGQFQDQADFCDTANSWGNDNNSKCVNVAAWSGNESQY